MATETQVIRDEQLKRLTSFCRALAETLRQTGLGPDNIFVIFRDSVAVNCPQCGTHVPGEELFVLSKSEEGGDINAGVRRLRLGYCARPDCESYGCQFTFQKHSEVNWASCLSQVEKALQNQTTERSRAKAWRTVLLRQVAVLAAAVVVLLIIRQWYLGGRIPFIREPEKFRVDPIPPGTNLQGRTSE